MVDWASAWTYAIILGYLALLIIALARWRGLRLAIAKRANTLLLILFLAILFVALGGIEVLVGVIGFSLSIALMVAMIAGPIGFVLGLLIGVVISILTALS